MAQPPPPTPPREPADSASVWLLVLVLQAALPRVQMMNKEVPLSVIIRCATAYSRLCDPCE